MASDALKPGNDGFAVPPIGEHSDTVKPLTGFDEVPAGFPMPKPVIPPQPFILALSSACPLCNGTEVAPAEWTRDGSEQKTTLNIDAFGTALLNTATMSLAHMTGNIDKAKDIGWGVIELCRLFLRTIPIVTGSTALIIKQPSKKDWKETPGPAGEPAAPAVSLEQVLPLPQSEEEIEGFYDDTSKGKVYDGDDDD